MLQGLSLNPCLVLGSFPEACTSKNNLATAPPIFLSWKVLFKIPGCTDLSTSAIYQPLLTHYFSGVNTQLLQYQHSIHFYNIYTAFNVSMIGVNTSKLVGIHNNFLRFTTVQESLPLFSSIRNLAFGMYVFDIIYSFYFLSACRNRGKKIPSFYFKSWHFKR